MEKKDLTYLGIRFVGQIMVTDYCKSKIEDCHRDECRGCQNHVTEWST